MMERTQFTAWYLQQNRVKDQSGNDQVKQQSVGAGLRTGVGVKQMSEYLRYMSTDNEPVKKHSGIFQRGKKLLNRIPRKLEALRRHHKSERKYQPSASEITKILPEYTGQLEVLDSPEDAIRAVELEKISDYSGRTHAAMADKICKLLITCRRKQIEILNELKNDLTWEEGKKRSENLNIRAQSSLGELKATYTDRLSEAEKHFFTTSLYEKNLEKEKNGVSELGRQAVSEVGRICEKFENVTTELNHKKSANHREKMISAEIETLETEVALLKKQSLFERKIRDLFDDKISRYSEKAGAFGQVSIVQPQFVVHEENKTGQKIRLRKKMALKKQSFQDKDDSTKDHLLREARIHALSNAPIKVRSDIFIGNDHYMLMDAGEMDLASVFQKMESDSGGENLELPLRKAIILNLALQLKHLHAQNIVHHDIKPENVLVDPASGRISIIDYGLADFADENGQVYSNPGTPGYAAPELVLANSHTTKADVWSLGVVMAQCLAGYDMYQYFDVMLMGAGADTSEKTRAMIVSNRKIALDYIGMKLGKDSDEFGLIAKMLSVNPDERPSVSQILCHPFFAKPQTYAELHQLHQMMMNELAQLETSIADIGDVTGENGEKLRHLKEQQVEVRQKIRQIQDAMQWHDYSTQKKLVQKVVVELLEQQKQSDDPDTVNKLTHLFRQVDYIADQQLELSRQINPYLD